MGRVLITATIENMIDLYESHKGIRAPEAVRRLDLSGVLVDTGATYLSLPQRYIQHLGLERYRTRRARVSSGAVLEFGMYGIVRLTVQGRECTTEVAALSEDCPALLGQIPLEMLDFVVDSVGQRLIGNPDHGGEQMFDMF